MEMRQNPVQAKPVSPSTSNAGKTGYKYPRSAANQLKEAFPKVAKALGGAKKPATKSYGRSKIQNPSFISGNKQFYGPPFGYKNK